MQSTEVTPQRRHNHVLQGDTIGCPVCDHREGRYRPVDEFGDGDLRVYPALSRDEFEATAWSHGGIKIVGDEDGYYFWAYGHIAAETMAQAADELNRSWFDSQAEPFDADVHVRHIQAVRISPETDEWRIHWGAKYQNHPERFPITLLDVDGAS